MKILVSGASGNLGGLIIQHLIKRGVPVTDIVAGARSPRKVKHLEDQGIRVVRIDYNDFESLKEGLKGIDRFIIISVPQMDAPLDQYDLVARAVRESDLEVVAYTSIYKCNDSRLGLAPIHAAAEKAIEETGKPHIFLRNNGYSDYYIRYVMQGIQTGVITSPAGRSKISGAAIIDFAEAAAVAITDDKYIGKTLELAGDTAFTFYDLAQIASDISHRKVTYQPIPLSEYISALRKVGYPENIVEVLVKVEEATVTGGLYSEDHTLSTMIGHPTMNMEELVRNRLGL